MKKWWKKEVVLFYYFLYKLFTRNLFSGEFKIKDLKSAPNSAFFGPVLIRKITLLPLLRNFEAKFAQNAAPFINLS